MDAKLEIVAEIGSSPRTAYDGAGCGPAVKWRNAGYGFLLAVTDHSRRSHRQFRGSTSVAGNRLIACPPSIGRRVTYA